MKRLFTLFGAFAMCVAMMAQAQIKFEKTMHNFGTFDEGQVQTCVFVFTNTGDEPLIIHQAYSSCGCTVPTFSKDPIKPGEKGEIKVSYNGRGKFPGSFKKPVTIRTNATNPIVRVYIEGVMTVEGKTSLE